MSQAIIMIYINITNFVIMSKLEKDHSMIETHRLKNVVIFFQTILKVHQCRSENLQISLSSHKNNMPKVSHYSRIYFLRYEHPRYMKCWFTNIQKQQNMLKSSLLFFRELFLYKLKHILKFSNQHQCTLSFVLSRKIISHLFFNFVTLEL